MKHRIANLLRSLRAKLAFMLMDKRDREYVNELETFMAKAQKKVGHRFVQDLYNPNTIFIYSDERESYH